LNPTLNPYRREASHLCCQILATWKVAAYGQSGLHRLSVGREMKARKRNMQYRAHRQVLQFLLFDYDGKNTQHSTLDCCRDEPVKTFPCGCKKN
jgi:hypothetical protein